MKTKAIIFFVACAALTLSFTFSTSSKHAEVKAKEAKHHVKAPAGGIALEDR